MDEQVLTPTETTTNIVTTTITVTTTFQPSDPGSDNSITVCS